MKETDLPFNDEILLAQKAKELSAILKNTRKMYRIFPESPFVEAVYQLFGLTEYARDKNVLAFQIGWREHCHRELVFPVALKIWNKGVHPVVTFLQTKQAERYSKWMTKGSDYIEQGLIWGPLFVDSYRAGTVSTQQLRESVVESVSFYTKKQVQRKVVATAVAAAFHSTARLGAELTAEIGATMMMSKMSKQVLFAINVGTFISPVTLPAKVLWFVARVAATDYAFSQMEPHWKPYFNKMFAEVTKVVAEAASFAFMYPPSQQLSKPAPKQLSLGQPYQPTASDRMDLLDTLAGRHISLMPWMDGVIPATHSLAVREPAILQVNEGSEAALPMQGSAQLYACIDGTYVNHMPDILSGHAQAQSRPHPLGPTSISINNHGGQWQFNIKTSNPYVAGAILAYVGFKSLTHYFNPTLEEQFDALHQRILKYSHLAQAKKANGRKCSRQLIKVEQSAEQLLRHLPRTQENQVWKEYLLNVIAVCHYSPQSLIDPQQSLDNIQQRMVLDAEAIFAQQANLAISGASPGEYQRSNEILAKLRTFFPFKSTEILYVQSLVECRSMRYQAALNAINQSMNGVSNQIEELESSLKRLANQHPLEAAFCDQIRQGRIEGNDELKALARQQEALHQLLSEKYAQLSRLQNEKTSILFERANHTKSIADRDSYKTHAEQYAAHDAAKHELAQKLEHLGDLAAAVTYYEKALNLNNLNEVLDLGSLYNRLNRPEETRALYERYSAKHVNDEIDRYLAADYLETKQFGKLIHLLKRFQEEDVQKLFLMGVAHVELACEAHQQGKPDQSGYLAGKKYCENYIKTLQNRTHLDERQKKMLIALKSTLADGVMLYESRACALQAIQDLLILVPDCEPALFNAAMLSFDEKYTRQSLGYLTQLLTHYPANEKAADIAGQIQAYATDRDQLFKLDIGLLIASELLNLSTRRGWIRSIGGARAEYWSKSVAVGLQVTGTAMLPILRQRCARSLKKIIPTNTQNNSGILSLSNAASAVSITLGLFQSANSLGFLPADKKSQQQIHRYLSHLATIADMGLIATVSQSLYEAGITSYDQLVANNQAALGALSILAASCRIINRYTYEEWRRENYALPEKVWSYLVEDAFAAGSSPVFALALTIAGKCAEYPEEVATLLSSIPGLPEAASYVANGGATLANGASTLWACGVAGKLIIITGGAVIVVGAGYGVYKYIEHRDHQTIEYNALAAKGRGDFEEAKQHFERLTTKSPTAENIRKREIARAEYLVSQQKWSEVQQLASENLSKTPDPVFYELRARAASATQQVELAKADYQSAIKLTAPKDHEMLLSLYLSLMNVAPDDSSVYEASFLLLKEIQKKHEPSTAQQAAEYLKSTIIHQAHQPQVDAQRSQLLNQYLNRLLEHDHDDADVLLAKGHLLINQNLPERNYPQAMLEFEASLRGATTSKQKVNAYMALAEANLHVGKFLKAKVHVQTAKNVPQASDQEKQMITEVEGVVTQAMESVQQDLVKQIKTQYEAIFSHLDSLSEAVDFNDSQAITVTTQLAESFVKQITSLTDQLPAATIDHILIEVDQMRSLCLKKVDLRRENCKMHAWKQGVTANMDSLVRGSVRSFFDASHTASRAHSAHLEAELRVAQNRRVQPGFY